MGDLYKKAQTERKAQAKEQKEPPKKPAEPAPTSGIPEPFDPSGGRLYAALIPGRQPRCPWCNKAMYKEIDAWVCPNRHRWQELPAGEADRRPNPNVDRMILRCYKESQHPPGFKPKGKSKSGRRRKKPKPHQPPHLLT